MKTIGILAFVEEDSGGVFQYTQSVIDALKNDTSNRYIIFCTSKHEGFDDSGLEVRKFDTPQSSFMVKLFRLFLLTLKIQIIFFVSKEEKKLFKLFSDIDMFLIPVISHYSHYFFLKKPFVFTLHDMQERYYPKYFTFKTRVLRWILKNAMAKKAYKIICESEYVKSDIVKFTGVSRNKVSVIQSPPPQAFVNIRFDEINVEVVRRKYNLPKKYIFYPAQCWFHKNHIKLVEAFNLVRNEIDDVYLILTGSQQTNYCNVMKRVEELNLHDKVKHLGYIDYEDLPYLYKMSQMLMMPTLFESISIPIYEAFALKVPVCSSNVVGLPEQIGDAGLIFDPLDIVDMANKIKIYLTNEKLAQEKAQKGFDKVGNPDHDGYRKKILEVLNL
jgi:glycosyltransferase involved in cell wall biosynthesis